MTKTNGELHEPMNEITRTTNVIVEALGRMNLQDALTVICNLAGQLVAALAEGRPSGIQQHSNNVAENIKRAAIAKVLHDDKHRREQESGE